ncbi:MAG: pyridoxal kinase [Acidocella sp. 20-57-95]|nr:MAG: pyridoxal kinase [Acidocella sp. 20-57-95]HQT64357.1 pyridoxal kinase [Acidocella sp.]
MSIISVQSHVIAGYVGNAVASFALQRLGVETWALPTVLISHHPGHGGSQGDRIPVQLIQKLLDGMQSHGCFARCKAVISGYLGGLEDEDTVRDIVRRCQDAGSNFVYLCDPVIGDNGRTYVSPAVERAVRNLVQIADIATPNAYELSALSGRSFSTRAEALAALRIVQSLGPDIVLLSSFIGRDTAANEIDVLVVDRADAWRLSLPLLNYKFSGAGDLLAALFLHFWLPQRDVIHAINVSCTILHDVLIETAQRNAQELCIIEAQDRFDIDVGRFSVEVLN